MKISEVLRKAVLAPGALAPHKNGRDPFLSFELTALPAVVVLTQIAASCSLA